MAKQKKYFYECVMPCEIVYYGPDPRRERWKQVGKMLMQPTRCKHSVRVKPSPGYNAQGVYLPADYIATDKPLAKHWTHEVSKQVSRVDWNERVARGGTPRKMMVKTTKVKFRLLEDNEINDYIRANAWDFNEQWGPEMFAEVEGDVYLPEEARRMEAEGSVANASAKKGD